MGRWTIGQWTMGQYTMGHWDNENGSESENTLASREVRTYAELPPVSLARALGCGELNIPMKTPTVRLEPTTTRLRALRSAD